MNIAAVMDAIGDQIDTIAGLTVHRHPPDRVSPPAAVVVYPEEITFDKSYGRGSDGMTLPVVVVVGKPTARVARTRLVAYCDGTGAKSIKQVVEAGTYTAFDTVRVADVIFDVITIGGTDYLAAQFNLEIEGRGT